MRLGDVQNLYGKTLDTQALVQQAVSQPDTATRQTAAMLAAERLRNESQVLDGEDTAESGDTGLHLAPRTSPEKLRRYRMVLKNGIGPSVEIESNLPEPRKGRLDLNA